MQAVTLLSIQQWTTICVQYFQTNECSCRPAALPHSTLLPKKLMQRASQTTLFPVLRDVLYILVQLTQTQLLSMEKNQQAIKQI